MVREIFATIPARYDTLNRLLSLRRDLSWRSFAVEKMRFFQTNRLADLATGTADLAIMAARCHPQIGVTGLDLVREMLDMGTTKIREENLTTRISLLQADATDLPLPSGSFDVAAIAFGIRNIPDRPKALTEMARIVVPGGQVQVLEMHYPQQALFRMLYSVYMKAALPFMARMLSKNPGAYRYLSDSIRNFPSPPAFAALMSDAGLREIRQYPLTLGTTYLHIGIKP